MKKHANTLIAASLLLVALILGGCAGDPQGGDASRLAALEAEVSALKAKSIAQETAFKAELKQIRDNLEGIRQLINLDKERAKVHGSSETKKDKLQDDMDVKAKTFVNENLDRLMDITKKLLDKMESEIDKHTKENAPKPKGETI